MDFERHNRATALHEAGHAVAWLHFGFNTHAYIHLCENIEDLRNINYYGRCSLLLNPDCKTRRIGCHRSRVVKLAGPLAGCLVEDSEYYFKMGDDEWFELAVALVDEDSDDDWPKDCTDQQRFRAAREAMKVIRDGRDMLFQIADVLIINGPAGWSSLCSVPPPKSGASRS